MGAAIPVDPHHHAELSRPSIVAPGTPGALLSHSEEICTAQVIVLVVTMRWMWPKLGMQATQNNPQDSARRIPPVAGCDPLAPAEFFHSLIKNRASSFSKRKALVFPQSPEGASTAEPQLLN